MQPQVARELGVEGGHQNVALAAEDGMVVDAGQHLDVIADALDVRGPDEHRRDDTDAVHLELGLEGVDLTSEGVAPHGDVDEPEAALV